jgi:hypothetical protein
MKKFEAKRVGKQIVIPAKNFIRGFATPYFSSDGERIKKYGLHILANKITFPSWLGIICKAQKINGKWHHIDYIG